MAAGRVSITDHAKEAPRRVIGIKLPPVTGANLAELAREDVDRLKEQYDLKLRL